MRHTPADIFPQRCRQARPSGGDDARDLRRKSLHQRSGTWMPHDMGMFSTTAGRRPPNPSPQMGESGTIGLRRVIKT